MIDELVQDPAAGIGPFEGPEKTVTLCFRSSKMAFQSLRMVPQESWSAVLEHAKCMILSAISSGAVELSPNSEREGKRLLTGRLTGYLLSESSLFVSDDTVTLKTCGTTTPLLALEPILDLVAPGWRGKAPEKYLQYVTFTRLGYRFPDKQIDPHTSWDREVGFLNKHFDGSAVVLGKEHTSTYHAYVANYLPKGKISDRGISTQVALGHLNPTESLTRFVGTKASDKTPLKTIWQEMHGSDSRSVAASPELDECFFEPIGYSANACFGNRFTTIHATPQPSSSYVSVETSMPLTKEGKRSFVNASLKMCEAGSFSMTEFAFSPVFVGHGSAPKIKGFRIADSSEFSSDQFSCTLHYYVRDDDAMESCPSSPVLNFVKVSEEHFIPALTFNEAVYPEAVSAQ